MVQKYFDKFQRISYANTASVNLLERAVILKQYSGLDNPYVYYPYDVAGGERPDQVSDRYYKDEFMSWLIYMANDVVDPYYQWYLSPEDFNETLKKKYGVVNTDSLRQKVAFYRNNWYDSTGITQSEYQSLSPEMKKYWTPVYTGVGKISLYERKQVDWTVATNEVVSYDGISYGAAVSNAVGDGSQVVFTAPNDLRAGDTVQVVDVLPITFNSTYANIVAANSTTFTVASTNIDTYVSGGSAGRALSRDEVVRVYINGTYSGNAQVAFSNSTAVKVQHTIGSVQSNTYGGYVRGSESQSTVFFTSSSVVSRNITSDESIYWDRISLYDMENEKNELNRTIRLVSSAYAPKVAKDLKTLLK